MKERWDYRVIEFDDDGLKVYRVHAVFYEHSKPISYSVCPATLDWDESDGNAGPELVAQFAAAIEKSPLKLADFPQ